MIKQRHASISSESPLLFSLLLLAALLSALTVIYLKDLNRRLFIEHQRLEKIGQQMQVEWTRLLLEQSTLTAQARIESIAHQKWHMHMPANRDIVIVTVP